MFHTKKLHRILGGPVLLALVFVITLTSGVPTAFAQIGAPAAGNMNLTIVKVAEIIALINTFMHVLLLILLNMLQYLLQSDFYNNPKMMSALNSIWVLSRNIMNVIFAIMLIGVAIYTIITAKGDFIKSKISTFIIAVVLVNFSWFFPRVIIDVANVLTATLYSVPNMLPSFRCVDFDGTPCKAITDVSIFDRHGVSADPTSWYVRSKCTAAICSCYGIACYKIEDYTVAANKYGAGHAMINGMATTFVRIGSISKIPIGLVDPNPPGTVAAFKTTLHIMIVIMMTFVVQIAIVFPMLGLIAGLFIRILMLWITTAFMPFTFLGYVINGKLGTNIFGFNEFNVWDEFINAAFLPAVVAIPMVVGFIMLTVAAQMPAPSGYGMTWAVPLLSGVGSWWPFLWMFAAIFIFWVGTFAALARSKVTGNFTNRIKGMGESLAGAALQIPLLIPLPVGIGPRGGNLGTIFHGPKHLGDAIRRKAQGLPLGADTGRFDSGKVDGLTGTDRVAKDNTNRIVAAIQKIELGGDNVGEGVRDLHVVLGGSSISNTDSLEQLKKIVERPGIDRELTDKLGAINKAIEDSKK